MRKLRTLIFFISFSVALVACSGKNIEFEFDDNDIGIGIMNVVSTDGYQIYEIEIENNGKVDLYFIDLYLSYPIKQLNGHKGNPYKVEGETDESNPIYLKAKQSIKFEITTPIEEVFGDSDLLELEHPTLELNGFVKDGDTYVPFSIIKGT